MVLKALQIQIQNVREFLHLHMLVDHHQHYSLLLMILRILLLVLRLRQRQESINVKSDILCVEIHKEENIPKSFTYRFDSERSLLPIENLYLDVGVTFTPT